jgi:pimeloyl-ACP methyl ester carboxylesterase
MGWELRESGPTSAERTVLMLPGGLCSGEFYEDVMAEPALGSFRLIAATVPGMGRTPAPDDVTVENYASLGGKLAADLGCDVVVGHSMGANIALEMAAAGTFTGPIVLLSPSYSAADEATSFRVISGVSGIPLIGPMLWTLGMKGAPGAFKKQFPPERRGALVADLKNNDSGYTRRAVRAYFEYLRHHGEVASRLCTSGVKAWVVRTVDDEVAVQDDERKILQSCPTVTWVEEPEGSHMLLVEHPDWIARAITEAIAAT